MEPLTLGVIRRSRKDDELRVPIHPAHLPQIPAATRSRLIFERGYGERFGATDEDLLGTGVTLASREEILNSAGVVLLAKPLARGILRCAFSVESLDRFLETAAQQGIPVSTHDNVETIFGVGPMCSLSSPAGLRIDVFEGA